MTGIKKTLLLLLLFVVAAVAFWRIRGSGSASSLAAAAASASASADRTIPVVVAKVAVKDMPIALEGLGSVAPVASVTVRSQVDGRLERVSFIEGQNVKKGEVIAQIDSRPFAIQLQQAEAALARDAAQLRNGKLNLDRYGSLREQNLVPQQQVDDQRTLVDQYAATLQTDDAAIKSARLQLDYARITSPIDGVTGIRQVDPGNLIHAADPGGIVLVTQLDPIAVLFTLPQDDLARVAARLAAGALTVEAFARDGTTKLGEGRLALIDNQINAQTATIRLKAIFPNPNRVLWPNAFVKARLVLDIRKDAKVIPAVAIQRGPQGTFVYVVGADNRVAVRPVTVESLQGDSAIVADGLSAGDQVVIDGQSQLRAGSRVLARPPEGPPGSATTSEAKTSAAPRAPSSVAREGAHP